MLTWLLSTRASSQEVATLPPEGLFAVADLKRDEGAPLRATSKTRDQVNEPVRETGDPRAAARSVEPKPRPEGRESNPFTRRFPGISIDRLEPASIYEGDLKGESEKLPPPRLNLLDLKIEYDVRPDFVQEEPYAPTLDMEPRDTNPKVRAIKNLAQKEFFRQLRKHIKRQWRNNLRYLPNMSYDLYENRLLAINSVGRDTYDAEVDYYTSVVREDVFNRGDEGEAEIPVIRLGPLELLDTGSVHVDVSELRRILGIGKDKPSDPVEVGPEDSLHRRPLFSGNTYKLHTKLRVDVDPFRYMKRGEVGDVVRSYGAVVEVVWLTDILKRKRFITECEAQHRPDGEFRVFFNFVMKSR